MTAYSSPNVQQKVKKETKISDVRTVEIGTGDFIGMRAVFRVEETRSRLLSVANVERRQPKRRARHRDGGRDSLSRPLSARE